MVKEGDDLFHLENISFIIEENVDKWRIIMIGHLNYVAAY